MAAIPEEEPVLIVGGGPIGMTAAIALARFGVRSIVFEDEDRLATGSRAIANHRSALEVWERLGCVDAMVQRGIYWTTRRTYFRGVELFRQEMAPPARGVLPTYLNLQQCETEAILLAALQQTGLVEFHWRHKVTGIRQDDRGVTLDVETPCGLRPFRGSYALACDGARSTMRSLLELAFPGSAAAGNFIIADVRADLALPGEPRFYFDPPCNPGRQVLIHPQPENTWRIDWTPAQDEIVPREQRTDVERLLRQWTSQSGTPPINPNPDEVERRARSIDARIRSITGGMPYQLLWLSSYRFHQRLLEKFRHGRVFFAGDAAHLVAPFGARGMNSGIHDVDNLVWKLWLVLSGRAPHGLLDTYHEERWPAQLHNQKVTIKTMRFLVPETKPQLLLRNAILRLSRFIKPIRKLVNSGKMYGPFTYGDSRLNAREPLLGLSRWWWRGAPVPGASAPDAACRHVGAGDQPEIRLRTLFGGGFVALLFAPDVATARVFATVALAIAPAVPTRLYVVLPGAAVVDRKPIRLPADAHVLVDASGELADVYRARPGTCYVIRPDGHVCARRRTLGLEQLATLVDHACLRTSADVERSDAIVDEPAWGVA